MHILITGASGFIGGRVAQHLASAGHRLTLLGRGRAPLLPAGEGHRSLVVGPLETASELAEHCRGIDCVVHVAGRAHIMKRNEPGAAAQFRAANVDGVMRLCEAMEEAGIKRLVMLSSIAARLLQNEYGRSKRTGEEAALGFAKDSRIVIALRPPLVYGSQAPGNLATLLGLIERGLPLPFASLRRPRSLCSVDNLAEAIRLAVEAHSPKSGVYEIADDGTVVLPEMIQALAAGLGRRPRLFPVPAGLLEAPVNLLFPAIGRGLFGAPVLDNRPLKEMLQWSPSVRTLDGLRAVGAARRTSASATIAASAAKPPG